MSTQVQPLEILIERPETDDTLWVSRMAEETVDITVTADDCDGGTITVDYPLSPIQARMVARELLRLADEIDGRG